MKPTIADIFRQFGPQYCTAYGRNMLPSHHKTLHDIAHCRTQGLGGHVYQCADCHSLSYSYHSCNNRHCPQCQNTEITLWIDQQKQMLLPVKYFLITFTIPQQLHKVARSHQKAVYDILFKASAEALKELALDRRFLGGHIAMLGVLQTWTRDIQYHPHIHYIVPGGGITEDGNHWITPKNKEFLVHVRPLSALFKAKFKCALQRKGLMECVPAITWQKDWVVHAEAVGSGESVIKYVAPYVYRIAISNNRIVKLDTQTVTFRYKDSSTGRWKHAVVSGIEFLRRFLQHVVPRGFVKIRYYGFLSPNQRAQFNRVKQLLCALNQRVVNSETIKEQTQTKISDSSRQNTCRHCGGILIHLKQLPRKKRPP